MKLITKVSFELREDGKAKVELEGSNVVIKSGLLAIIERLAELEGGSVCENCSTHEEMPPELRAIFDKVFGGEK